ncbi:hypothetical protein PG990_008267 [Apiospora arundinis]|uniref:Ribosomal s17 protein n=1 Tax=Apiospora arundinis TaxID=335852 RepID=A0ABR2JLT7_9PEZI
MVAKSQMLWAFALVGLAVAQNNNNGQNNGNNNNNNNNNNGQNNNGDNNNNNNNGDNNNNNNNGDNNNNNNNGDNNNNNNNGGDNTGGDDATLTLDAAAVQTGSQLDGTEDGSDGAASATSDNNFINFCSGQQLTNGKQEEGGSCNGIPMGKIPSKGQMISTLVKNPLNNDVVEPNTTFDIQVLIKNLVAGSFTNAQTTYYSAPQDLEGGLVVGHTHVTVQDLGNSQNPDQTLDATQFVFFKGINDAGNGNGLLSATVDGGLPEGNFRVCTITSASNHQPVIMPIAQRGAQDDCIRFVVSSDGGNNNNNNNNNGQNNGGNNNNNNNNGQNNGDNNNNNQKRDAKSGSISSRDVVQRTNKQGKPVQRRALRFNRRDWIA